MKKINFEDKAKYILKSKLKRQGIDYCDLQKKLNKIGVKETYTSINQKINRGKFNFIFFLQCMHAIGIKTIIIDELT